jgi:class 3 adenylate cyclase
MTRSRNQSRLRMLRNPNVLRQLRFPPELERAYQENYFRASLKTIRLGFSVALVVLGAALIGYFFYYAPERGFEISVPIALVSPVFLLAFTYHKRFQEYWKPALTVFGACLGLQFLRLDAPLLITWRLPTTWSLVAAFGLQKSVMTIACVSIMRLPFLWTTILLWVMEAGAALILAHFYHIGAAEFHWYYFQTFIVLIFLMFTALTLERHNRADFLNHHLLDLERAKSENLLLNILPAPIAQRLKADPGAIADGHRDVSVLFADIVGFTPLSARLSAPEVVQLLNEIFSTFDALTEKHGLEKIKTIGDTYMAAGNLSKPCEGHLDAMAELALDMLTVIGRFGSDPGQPLNVRIGIHAGPLVAGVIGTRKPSFDVWGDTVNIASRMESHGAPGTIQLTDDAWKRLCDRYTFDEPRQLAIKGRGMMTTHRLLRRVVR